MSSGPTYAVKFRRRRQGLTNYKKRLALVKSKLPRFVVRITNRYIITQIVTYQENGDKVHLTVNSKSLKSFGWKGSCKNLPSAYLTGYLIGKKQNH